MPVIRIVHAIMHAHFRVFKLKKSSRRKLQSSRSTIGSLVEWGEQPRPFCREEWGASPGKFKNQGSLIQYINTKKGNVYSFRENIYVVLTPKMHFPAVPAQDRFCFLNERELQMNQRNNEILP